MLRRLRTTEPVDATLGFALAFSLAVTLPAYALDDRLLQGDNVWIKTIKFQVALAVYFLTLAYYARFVPAGILQSKKYKAYSLFVCFAVVCEMVWIGGASANATASHYNTENQIMIALYGIMGFFAVTLTSKSLVFGWMIWRNDQNALDLSLKRSIALGLVLTFVLTVISAGTLSSMPGHFIGTPSSGASVPILGWSLEVGDLRVAHFFATHAMHFVPLFGLFALALSNRTHRSLVVMSSIAAYVGLVGLTFVQALLGRPVFFIL